MNLKESINSLNKDGFCLWVGAGVAKYLATGTKIKIPAWKNLVEELEKITDIIPPQFSTTLPERLNLVSSRLNKYTFQQKLRQLLLVKIAKAVIEQREINCDRIPIPIYRVAKLGLLANPIVNFNIEALTSVVLATGGGHYSIKTYGKKVFEENNTISRGTGFSMRDNQYEDQRFKRHIYHPHGNIDGYGVSVITDNNYDRHTSSLSYQLAVHNAFDNTLAIVGMSLEDKYLREQIGSFREEINNIFWFQASTVTNEEIKKWCWKYDINLIIFDKWVDFWDEVDSTLPNPLETDILLTWLYLITESINIINDSFEAEKTIKMWKSMDTPDNVLLEIKIALAKRGIVFSDSLDSKPIISAHKSAELIKNILKKIKSLN